MVVAYTVAAGDLETGLGNRTVVVVESKASWGWKVCAAFLLVALCAVSSLFCAWYWNGRPSATIRDQTNALLNKQTGMAHDHQNTLKRIGSHAKAAMHLEGDYNSTVLADQVEWKMNEGQGFSQGGLELENNQIVIPHTGLYFVYSQVSFRVSCDGGQDNAGRHTKPLSHRIWCHSDSIGGNTSLLSAIRSACQLATNDADRISGEGWYNAIYLGAVFQLKKGDSLWTETNRLEDLESEGGKTFFGVFAL
ncbi:tumor necrosis factor b (TNF superfamily, member 2) [Aplochiton taeniatus]